VTISHNSKHMKILKILFKLNKKLHKFNQKYISKERKMLKLTNLNKEYKINQLITINKLKMMTKMTFLIMLRQLIKITINDFNNNNYNWTIKVMNQNCKKMLKFRINPHNPNNNNLTNHKKRINTLSNPFSLDNLKPNKNKLIKNNKV